MTDDRKRADLDDDEELIELVGDLLSKEEEDIKTVDFPSFRREPMEMSVSDGSKKDRTEKPGKDVMLTVVPDPVSSAAEGQKQAGDSGDAEEGDLTCSRDEIIAVIRSVPRVGLVEAGSVADACYRESEKASLPDTKTLNAVPGTGAVVAERIMGKLREHFGDGKAESTVGTGIAPPPSGKKEIDESVKEASERSVQNKKTVAGGDIEEDGTGSAGVPEEEVSAEDEEERQKTAPESEKKADAVDDAMKEEEEKKEGEKEEGGKGKGERGALNKIWSKISGLFGKEGEKKPGKEPEEKGSADKTEEGGTEKSAGAVEPGGSVKVDEKEGETGEPGEGEQGDIPEEEGPAEPASEALVKVEGAVKPDEGSPVDMTGPSDSDENDTFTPDPDVSDDPVAAVKADPLADFTGVLNVETDVAESLLAAGYRSLADLKDAIPEDLEFVEGVDAALAGEICARLEKHTFT